jgi:hypothetical protein
MTARDDKPTPASIREMAKLARDGESRIVCAVCGNAGVSTSLGAVIVYSESGLEYVHGACINPPSIRRENEGDV